MKFTVLSLFPEAVRAALDFSLIKKSLTAGRIELNTVQIRDFSTDKHKTVDDSPYGGGEGMLMRADVLHRAWASVALEKGVAESSTDESSLGSTVSAAVHTVFLSPQGKPLTSEKARQLASFEHLVLVCGHYEGVDQRFIDLCVDEELSIGDYVLTGGELAAAVVVDAVSRFIPSVVQNLESVNRDSFEGGLLKYPQYTRPPVFESLPVPEVLLGGDHKKIEAWRKEQSLKVTQEKRPDLLKSD